MAQERRLRIALIVVGAGLVTGVYPLINLWQSDFRRQPAQPGYEQMTLGRGTLLRLAVPDQIGLSALLMSWASITPESRRRPPGAITPRIASPDRRGRTPSALVKEAHC